MKWGLALRRGAGWCVRSWLLVLLLAVAVQAQPQPQSQPPSPSLDQQLGDWQAQLDAAEKKLDAGFTDDGVTVTQGQLEQLLRQVRQGEQAVAQQLQAVQKRADTLGEAPAEDAPLEDPLIAQLRADLNKQLADARAHEKRMELVRSRAETLLTDIAGWERRQAHDVIMQRNPMPLSLSIWRQAGAGGLAFARELIALPSAWWTENMRGAGSGRRLLWLLALPLGGLLLTWPLRRGILRRFGRNPQEPDPSYARRIGAALADGLANIIVPVVMISLVVGVLAWQGVLAGLFGNLIYAVVAVFSAALLVFGLFRAALSPQLVQWRVVSVVPTQMHALLGLLALVLGLLAVSLVLTSTAWRADLLTPPLEAVFFLLQSLVTALALTGLLAPRLWIGSTGSPPEPVADAAVPDDAGGGPARAGGEAAEAPPSAGKASRWIWVLLHLVRWSVWITPLLALAGWGRLAFVAQLRLVGSVALIGVVWLIRLALREALQRLINRHMPAGAAAAGSDAADPWIRGRMRLFWWGLLADILLLVPAAYALLLLNGTPWAMLRLWTRSVLGGFSMGNVSVTPSNLLVAVAVFAIGLALTSLLRRWLAGSLLPNTRLDPGAQHSVAVGTGYVGVALTLLLVVSALGIDMSRLTIVLGALSLGIGFGLQNLVQNFAAGILLLIERPIKVGDWIQIGATEGTVKRISVRSTEIEVFDRSTVFVPNSELTAQQVVNRTHRNPMTRLTLPIRVAQDADPRHVERVLLDCVAEQAHVCWYPESYVWFRGFADGVLNFELRVFIDDVNERVAVDNSLHHAIAVAFREAGLVIPYPQRDVHLRRAAAAGPASAAPPPPGPDAAAPD